MNRPPRARRIRSTVSDTRFEYRIRSLISTPDSIARFRITISRSQRYGGPELVGASLTRYYGFELSSSAKYDLCRDCDYDNRH
jgi:hypothetical protein